MKRVAPISIYSSHIQHAQAEYLFYLRRPPNIENLNEKKNENAPNILRTLTIFVEHNIIP